MQLLSLYFEFELKRLLRDRTLLLTSLAFFALLLFSLYNGKGHVDSIWAEHGLLEQEEQARKGELLSAINAKMPKGGEGAQADLTPYNIGGKSAKQYVYKSPAPLAFLSEGQSQLFPSEYAVSLSSEDFTVLSGHDHLENPLLLYLGRFDFAFFMVWLLPLLALLYAYNLRSEEAEVGTLDLLRSQAVSLGQLLWVKMGVRYTYFTVFVLASCSIGFALIEPSALREGGELSLLFGLSAAYLLFWFLLALFVNLLRQSSITNLSLLFAAWLLIVLGIPTGLSLMSDAEHPLPSRLKLVNDIRTATQEIDNDAARLLDDYYFDHPELVPEGEGRSMAQYVYKNALKQKMVEKAARPVVEAYQERVAQQGEYLALRQFFSPALLYQSALDGLARNRLTDFLDFQQRVDKARQEWRQLFEPKIFRDERMRPEEVRALPEYEYRPEQASVLALGPEALGLLGFSLALVLAVWCMGRYGIGL